ncbi:MAG: outer membrane protein assembly factor BamD [Myxococcales bacterium]|nr:outer membrane protein assembly factor BamD [Myxococcales bacterium]
MRSRRVIALWRALLALPLLFACATTDADFANVAPADELYATGLELLEGDALLWVIPRIKYNEAIETFQTIIDNYPYSDYAVRAELKIADSYFDQGKYEEALSYYRDFGDLHPQNEKVPYTLMRAALCHERRVKPPYRDQTATRDALLYLDRLISKYPLSEFTPEAEESWRKLRLRLAEQILGIADFYRKRDEYESAAARYRSLLNEYPGLGLDASALFHLGVCYRAMDREQEAERIFQAVVQNYYDSDVARDAEQMIAEDQ